jgi:hypothetical protein
MEKFYINSFWLSLKTIISKQKIIISSLLIVMSMLLLYLAEKTTVDQKFLYLSQNTWLTVTGSILAAAIFNICELIISTLQKAENNIYKNFYSDFVGMYCMKKIFTQRGSPEIIQLYAELIRKAQKRIWAFGMTNRHFLDQNIDAILELLNEREIEIVISFWNPTVFLENGTESRNIIDIQHLLEGTETSTNWEKIIKERQSNIKRNIHAEIKGEIKIINMAIPTNFSCFIIDDDVFFFPFLAGPESTNDPMMQCFANKGLGFNILTHYRKLLNKKEVTEIVYHQKNKINIIDNL